MILRLENCLSVTRYAANIKANVFEGRGDLVLSRIVIFPVGVTAVNYLSRNGTRNSIWRKKQESPSNRLKLLNGRRISHIT
jgi:hypothetical protein